MEIINCPICNSKNENAYIRGVDVLHGVPGEFTLSKCNCGLIYVNPQPNNVELQKFYPDDYCPHRERKVDYRLKKHKAFKIFVLRWYYGCPIEKSAPPRFLRLILKPFLFWISLSTLKSMIPFYGDGKIIDVGCGNGGWLIRLKECGWDVQGVEIDEAAAKDANSAGVPTFCGTLCDTDFPADFFDVVRLHYVFEHLINPKETLDEIRRILKPNGICYIRIPNIEGINFKIFKKNWFPLDIPRHVFHYSPKTFKKLIEQHGLKIIKTNFKSPATGFYTSLKYLKKDKKNLPFFLKIMKDKNSSWKNLWRPIGWIIDRLHKGDMVEYTIVRNLNL